MADPQFTLSSTPSQITDRGWVTAPTSTVVQSSPEPVSQIRVSLGPWTRRRSLMRSHADSRHWTLASGPVKENSSGFGQSKKAFILRRGGEEPCSGRGNDRSCLVNAASAMCLLLGRKQSKCWYSSNSRHVVSAAFLMTLVWHSPITDLWSCHGRQELQFLWVRHCRGTRARPQPKNEHLFPNKSSDKNDIVQLLSHVWNGWTSESLFMNTIFFTPSTPPQPDLWVHSPHQRVPTTKDLERGHMSVQPPSSRITTALWPPREGGRHWRIHEPRQL